MPTPLEILLDPISLIALSMYALLIIWEALFPASELPKVKNWKLKGLFSFFVYFFLSSYLPLLTDPFLSKFQLFDLTGLGNVGGGILAIILYEFGLFFWHWAIHKSDILWRVFHQMHHSPERMDTYGAFYFSIFDMIGFTFLGSICLALFIGVTPQAVTIMLLTTMFLAIFQHTNIRTPQWLGYIVQRPESHTVHHARGVHKYNYSDLPVFDMMFGTFKNPKGYEHETGFYEGASSKIIEMLTFQDINKSKSQAQKS
ncbi:sterol desaturase family protein [Lutimonas vermicola]|uniref:Sterol desaturase family protein n=1 Tax=Lutimonas vermicola TaxID=414288 RepID=A0ABU9L3P8_9FLAO